MSLSPKMKNLINDLAQEVINVFDIQIPITDIDQVVGKLGGKVLEDSSIDGFSDGEIRKLDSESFEIRVFPYQTRERRNFTIAHELGHLFLHMGFCTNPEEWNKQKSISYYRSGNSSLEYQSNEFAAAFLMPQKIYKEVMDKNRDNNIVYTAKIAEYFHVSIDAAANRGKWLGYLEW